MGRHRLAKSFGILVVVFLSVAILAGCSKGPKFATKQPNVLILMLDTLRADHMGVYGYERDTTPTLDKFAKENVFFRYPVSAAPWTPMSVSSILTGLYPATHQMIPPNSREAASQTATRLNSNLVSLSEALQSQGYGTAAVSPNPWITPEFGFDQGFEIFRFHDRAKAEEINKHGIEIIEGWKSSNKPWFLYLHYLDPHDPYTPEGIYKEMFSGKLAKRAFNYPDKMQNMINRYDGEIRYLDDQLGKLFEYLKGAGLYEDLMIVVVADHGEQFMEHGNHRHGFQLYDEELFVPLFIRTGAKSDQGRVVEHTVSTVDIVPTVLERVGLPIPAGMPGSSLLSSEGLGKRRGVLSQIRRRYDQRAITNPRGMRLILSIPFDDKDTAEVVESKWRTPRVEGVYDRVRDPLGFAPLTDPGLEASLRTSFDALYQASASNQVQAEALPQKGVSNETLEKLKSMGYLQ